MKWGARQSHETCSCRFQDTKWRNELHEGIYSGRFCGTRELISIASGRIIRLDSNYSHFNYAVVCAYV